MLQRCCCLFGGCSGLMNKLAALVAVDNTSAVEVKYRLPSSSLLFAWNLTPKMRICIACQLHRILYREFNFKSSEGQREDSKDPPFAYVNAAAADWKLSKPPSTQIFRRAGDAAAADVNYDIRRRRSISGQRRALTLTMRLNAIRRSNRMSHQISFTRFTRRRQSLAAFV